MTKTSRLRRQRPFMVRNLLRVFEQATPDEVTGGIARYPDAAAIAARWARRNRVPVPTVCAVIAAISPQCEWTRNLLAADDVLRGKRLIGHGAIRANVAKAKAIYRTRAESTRAFFLDAPKVRSFEANLRGDLWGAVTIDGHAAQAALNTLGLTNVRALYYDEFVRAYMGAAAAVNLPPAVLQAITWVAWKRMHPPAAKRNARREEER